MNTTSEMIRLYARQLKIPTFAEYEEILRQADPAADFGTLLLELMKTQTVGLPEEQWETGDGGVLQMRCHVPVLLLKLPDKEQLAALEDYQ